ncbi:MAG: hypothetical protein IJS73_02440 [Paludibacteraceae bacterium]|nr:hypothetical protein [Paludibacteraceae bacterium]
MKRLSLSASFALIPDVLYSEQEQDLWVNFGQEHIPTTQTLVAEELPQFGCVLVYDSADALSDISTDINLQPDLQTSRTDDTTTQHTTDTTAQQTAEHTIAYLLKQALVPQLEGRQFVQPTFPQVLLHADNRKLCVVVLSSGNKSQIAPNAPNQTAIIELANIYPAQKQEDILYYTLRAYQNCNLQQDTPCRITQHTDKLAGALLKEYLSVSLLK